MSNQRVAVRMKRIGAKHPDFLKKQAERQAQAVLSKHPAKMAHYQAAEGKELPVVYLGSIVRIGSQSPVGLDLNVLPHESKVHIMRALKEKELREVAAPEVEAPEAQEGAV